MALRGLAFRRFAGGAALLSVPLAVGCLVTGLAAAKYDFAALGDPTRALGAPPPAATLTFWSMQLDLFGYYLLLLPLAVALWHDLRPGAPAWVDLVTLCGIGYVLVGAAGAAVLAAVWPPLIQGYAADPSGAGTTRLLFEAATRAVDQGLWNMLELILGGVWWVGLGRLLGSRGVLAWVSIALGLAAWLDAAGTIARLPVLATIGLSLYLVLVPLWATLCGARLWRGPLPPSPAAA